MLDRPSRSMGARGLAWPERVLFLVALGLVWAHIAGRASVLTISGSPCILPIRVDKGGHPQEDGDGKGFLDQHTSPQVVHSVRKDRPFCSAPVPEGCEDSVQVCHSCRDHLPRKAIALLDEGSFGVLLVYSRGSQIGTPFWAVLE